LSIEGQTRDRALAVEGRIDAAVRNLIHPAPGALFRGLRTYLQQRADRGRSQNVHGKIQLLEKSDVAAITLGPSIDKGETDKHFLFASGARLSFGLNLKAEEAGSRLIAYRYHLHLRPNTHFEFLRFDLNQEQHMDPLREPRCHIHLGTANVRVASVVLDPFELLDRLFLVVEPTFQ
jgi:hypothetical protein